MKIKSLNEKVVGYSFLGLLYISLSWGLMIAISTRFDDPHIGTFGSSLLVILVIASIWINDTMAYIVGSLIGKTPLSKISPKKTWEGTIGGIILSMVVIGLFSLFVLKHLYYNILIIAFISAVTGTFGDLLESKLKRMADVKDSGNFMPGHGGFLDRFDSLLIATPFVWLFIKLFM